MVPDVHCPEFFSDEQSAAVAKAKSFFNDKWWRKTERYPDQVCRAERERFCKRMRQYESTVWKPLSNDADNKSRTVAITVHSLDSLLWEYVTAGVHTPEMKVNLADIYFFCLQVSAICEKAPTLFIWPTVKGAI